MFSKLNAHKNQKGFTLIELLIVIAIIGILAAVAIPQFSQYRNRAHSASVKSDLHNVYLSCKAHWGDTTPTTNCSLPIIKGNLYGFSSTAGVNNIIFTDATENNLKVTATHDSFVGEVWTLTSNGVVVKTAAP